MGQKLESVAGRRAEPRYEIFDPGVNKARCQLLGRNLGSVAGPRSKDTKKWRAVNVSWPFSFTARSRLWLDFPPRGRASARPVRRGKVFGHHTFVTLRQRCRIQCRARPDDTGREDHFRNMKTFN